LSGRMGSIEILLSPECAAKTSSKGRGKIWGGGKRPTGKKSGKERKGISLAKTWPDLLRVFHQKIKAKRDIRTRPGQKKREGPEKVEKRKHQKRG